MNKLPFTSLLSLQSPLIFAATENGRWHAGIGDPTIFGWITVAAYLLAVICSLRQMLLVKAQGGTARFWLVLAAVLFVLAINKQLDWQSWFTQIMRDSANANGWYPYRRVLQSVFIAALALGMFVVLLSIRIFLANSWRHYKLVWVGISLLCTFVLMRAASFNHMDVLINKSILGARINVILELSAIFLIILGSFYHKKFVEPLTLSNTPSNGYVEIAHEGDDVRCPKCGVQPLAAGHDGRLFKCRSCGFKFRVSVVDT
jgi:hypothetical protein